MIVIRNIKVDTEKDIQLLKAIAKVGFVTEDFLKNIGSNKQGLKDNIKQGYIMKKGTYMVYGGLKNIYNLTSKGKYKVKSDFLINPYKSDISQLEHDYCLAKVYQFLSYEEKQSWITETGLRVRYGHAVTTDAMYITREGKKIGVEIVTDSYSKNEIESKMDFIRNVCDDYLMFHTHKDKEYAI